MNVGKHTPGPWEVQQFVQHPHSNKITYVVASDVFDVVSPHLLIRRPEDALLIAAAPDMLEQLEDARNEILGLCEISSQLENNDQLLLNLEMRIGETIAKAKGQKS